MNLVLVVHRFFYKFLNRKKFFLKQLPQQSDEFTPFSQQQSQNTQQNFQIYGKSLKTENYSPANLATTTTHSMPKSVENIQQNSLDNYKFVRSNEMKYEVFLNLFKLDF